VKEIEDFGESRHSKWTYASFSSYGFTVTFLEGTITVFLFFYYEVVLGLSGYLIFLAMTIFTVYNAINDPIFGFLVDRNFKWTKKWGRRFPWIVIGIFPWCISLYLIYSAPNIDASVNPLPVFLWLLMSLFIYDTFNTLVGINILALRPDKFRSERERRNLAGYFTPLSMVAQVIAMIVPPLFLSAGDNRAAFAFMAGILSLIAIVSAVLFIPGAREDQEIIQKYYSEYESMNFVKGAKEVFKLKSFIVLFLLSAFYLIANSLLTQSVIYIVTFVLRASALVVTVLFALFLIAALLSVPFWVRLSKKVDDNKKTILIACIAFSLGLIPMSFFQGIIDLYIFTLILGFSIGGLWTLLIPLIQLNVFDDFVVKTRKNQKGVLIGVWALLSRLVASVDEFVIAFIHDITGFVAGAQTYEELAQLSPDVNLALWGLRLQWGLVPMLFMVIGTLIFWKFYPLTQDKVRENQEKLKELGF